MNWAAADMTFEDPIDLEVQYSQFFEDDLEFAEFAAKIESQNETAILDSVLIKARFFSFDTVLIELERAGKNVDDDPEDALTSACALVECVCRSILVELDEPLPKDLSLKPLYKAVREPLGLSPGKEDVDPLIANDVREILSGIGGAVEGIAKLRSHGGDAHGRKKGVKRIDARISRLSVNASSSISLFLIETWQKKYPNRTLPNIDVKLTN